MTLTELEQLALAAQDAIDTDRYGKPWVVLAEFVAALSPERIHTLLAVIKEADAIRGHMAKVSTCKCGSNQCGWCRKVNAYDAARKRLEDRC